MNFVKFFIMCGSMWLLGAAAYVFAFPTRGTSLMATLRERSRYPRKFVAIWVIFGIMGSLIATWTVNAALVVIGVWFAVAHDVVIENEWWFASAAVSALFTFAIFWWLFPPGYRGTESD